MSSLIKVGKQLVTLREQETVLDALERMLGPEQLEYQCRIGICGACRCKLVSGEVSYINEPLAYIRHDEVLPCCCVPKQDIELSFD